MRVFGSDARAVLLCCHLVVTLTSVQGQYQFRGRPDRGSRGRHEEAARELVRLGAVIPRSSFVRGYLRSLSNAINDINRRMTFPEKYELNTASVTIGMIKEDSSPMSEWMPCDPTTNSS